jgi:lipopolysaccharide transport system permease protein
MARVATSGWVSGNVEPARLRLYHILFVIAATLMAIAVAAPSVLSQRPLYRSNAVVRYDPAVFPDLVVDGRPGEALLLQQENLGGVLQQTKYPELRQHALAYSYRTPGEIVVSSVAYDPALSPSIARDAAEGLVRRIYAISGIPLLRNVLGHTYQAALERHPFQGREDRYLSNLLQSGVIPGVTPQLGERALGSLKPAEIQAVTRALEVQEDLILLDLRSAEQSEQQAQTDASRQEARERRRGALSALTAVRLLVTHLYDTYDGRFDVRSQAPAFLSQEASTASAIPTYTLIKLLIAGAVGFLGGAITVLLDRSVGIARKLAELWAYRELIRNMVMRDLKARYKHSILGYFWSLLNPLMTMLIFWLVFSVLLRSDIPMFPIFLLVALLPWNFAVTAVSGGMRAIIDNANLVKKVYFPREILPITVVLANLVNYLLALPVMFVVMAGIQLTVLHELRFSWTFAFLPVILMIQIVFLIGITLFLSTIAIFFRDTTHIIDIFIQLWIFLTPVFYSLELVTQGNVIAAKAVRWLNPMASLIDFYRDILYGQPANPVPGLPALDGVFRTLLTALVILAIGAYVFHRNSAHFGEEL